MASRADDGPMQRYIERVRAIPRLSREDEHELAVRVRQGDKEAADKLVEANLRFVVAVALQYRRYGIPIGELMAEGNLGLMMAVDKFDPDRGTRFVTFRRVSIEHDGDGLTVRVAEAAPPPMGSERFRIAGRMVDLEVRASPAAVSVSGRMEIEATLGRREIEEAVPFSLRGAGLDTEAASFTAEVELTENLRRLRERHERRVAEQAAAAAAPPEPPLDERIHGLRESLQETLDSMRDGS